MAEHTDGTNAKPKKILKKADGQMLFFDEAYTLSLTSGKDYSKGAIEVMMAKMNANIDEETKKKQFFYLLGIPAKNGRLLESEPRFLKMYSKFPAVQGLYAYGTSRNHQHHS